MVKRVGLAGQCGKVLLQADESWLNLPLKTGKSHELMPRLKVLFSGAFLIQSLTLSEGLQPTPSLEECSGHQQGGHQRAFHSLPWILMVLY